ncbi:MAG: SGNH/GDSL hydrolase family protein [Syntrophales bacterium]|nr:SGNH/GDSL hydrolase family protein [Syntrophales bacterium]
MPLTPDTTDKSWFHQNPKKTLALIIGVVLLLNVFAAEKILQFYNHQHGVYLETDPRYIRLKEYRPGTRLMLPFPPDYQPFTEHVFTKKYSLRIDGDGFIMPSRKYAHPDLSLVFLGGSTTECLFVDEDKRFPYLAGTILGKETGQKINSYNAGMSGINTLNCIDILVNKVIPLHPRVVVFMENINDLSTLLYEGAYWSKNTTRAPIETLKKSKLLGKLLKEATIPNLNYAYKNLKTWLSQKEEDEFAAARGKKLKVDQARFNREFAMNLQIIIDICKARGITPVLMTQANRITAKPDRVVKDYVDRFGRDSGLSYREFKELYDSFNATIRRVGRENQVMVIDLAAEVPPDKKYLYDMVHFNDAGCQYAAGLIAARLKDIITPPKKS